MIVSVEGKQSGLLPNPSIEESSRMTLLAPFFKSTDTVQLCFRQSMFISLLLGGRVVYTGKDIHAGQPDNWSSTSQNPSRARDFAFLDVAFLALFLPCKIGNNG